MTRVLLDALDPGQFDVIQEMRIVAGGKVRYPDVAVVAAPIEDTRKTLRDAFVLFEVLSDETADTDLNAK